MNCEQKMLSKDYDAVYLLTSKMTSSKEAVIFSHTSQVSFFNALIVCHLHKQSQHHIYDHSEDKTNQWKVKQDIILYVPIQNVMRNLQM